MAGEAVVGPVTCLDDDLDTSFVSALPGGNVSLFPGLLCRNSPEVVLDVRSPPLTVGRIHGHNNEVDLTKLS